MKSNKHEGCFRQFIITSQAWYGEAQNFQEGEDEIMIGMYHPEGGTTGEFGIRWSMLGGESTPALRAFSDSWSSLWHFQDVLQKLAALDGSNPTVTQVAEVLLACGVQDATERTGPYTRHPGSAAEAEKAVQIYQVTLQAYQALRNVAREQGDSPTWAENAEYGVATKTLSSVDAALSRNVLEFAKTLIIRREAGQRAVDAAGDSALAAKYQDLLAVPAGVQANRRG